MKRVYFILILFLGLHLSAQEPNHNSFPAVTSEDSVTIRSFRPGLLPFNFDKKLSFRLEVGSAFGFSSSGGQMFGVFTSPHFSYKLSDKWRINSGLRIQNSNFLSWYNPFIPHFPERMQIFDHNITQTLMYAESEYLINPRLLISTKVFKEVSLFNEPQVNPYALDLSGEGVSFGINYLVNDNFHFGAEVGISRGVNPYNPWYPATFGYPGRSPYKINSLSPFD
jgi:hypothetical protein